MIVSLLPQMPQTSIQPAFKTSRQVSYAYRHASNKLYDEQQQGPQPIAFELCRISATPTHADNLEFRLLNSGATKQRTWPQELARLSLPGDILSLRCCGFVAYVPLCRLQELCSHRVDVQMDKENLCGFYSCHTESLSRHTADVED